MGFNLEQKKTAVAEISSQLGKAQAVVLAEYRGTQVGEMTQLRARARGAGVYFRVLKNTLARRAIAGTPFAALSEKLQGPLAYGISADPVAAAKILYEFAKENESFVIKGGAMANFLMTSKDIANLAKMPSRKQLLAKLAGTLQAPIARLVRTLNEVPGKFLRTLAAIRDRKSA